jgi:hypothetical protein
MELGYLTGSVRALLQAHGGGERQMELDFREAPPGEIRKSLARLSAKDFSGAPCPEGALSGLWLYFNEMNEAHRICQDMPTVEGSFWHGIVHRREPDPANAGYWFRRVGAHPVFAALHGRAGELSAARPEAGFDPGSRWDPFAFIDFCESARARRWSPQEQLAKEIQLAEWQLLFEYCARSAR